MLAGATREALASLFAPDIWTWDERVGKWRGKAINYSEVRRLLRARFGSTFQDDIPTPEKIRWPQLDLPMLRPDQQEALKSWRQSRYRGQIIMPTGTGKTEVALAAMAAMNVATLVVAPVRDLMYQWHHRILRRTGYDAGIVGDSCNDPRAGTVTTYDSATIRMPEIGARFGLIIFDEEHHLPGRYYREAAELCPAPMRLELPAARMMAAVV